jgi:hypothetical protein
MSESSQGATMFRFERTTTVKHAAEVPAAVQFASDVTSYLNRHYKLDMKFGVELFGEPRIHWYFDAESLDDSEKLNAALLKDEEYGKMLKKTENIWIEQSMHDSIVRLS